MLERILEPVTDEYELRAYAFMQEFGSLQAALSGSRARQLRAAGGDQRIVRHLRLVRSATLHMLRRQAMSGPLFANWSSVLKYLQVDMGHDTTERFRALYLNTRNILLRDEILWRGTVDSTQVHVREVIARAIELGAAAMILVHNHPSGDPEPSRADIDLTKVICRAAALMQIAVHDHVIVSKTGCISMRAAGLM